MYLSRVLALISGFILFGVCSASCIYRVVGEFVPIWGSFLAIKNVFPACSLCLHLCGEVVHSSEDCRCPSAVDYFLWLLEAEGTIRALQTLPTGPLLTQFLPLQLGILCLQQPCMSREAWLGIAQWVKCLLYELLSICVKRSVWHCTLMYVMRILELEADPSLGVCWSASLA